MPRHLYRFRIVGEAQNGDLRAIDAARDTVVHLIRIPVDKIAEDNTAPAVAQKIEVETGCEAFSSGDVYIVAENAAKRPDILRICDKYGLIRPEPVKTEIGANNISSNKKTSGSDWNVFFGAICVVGLVVLLIYLGQSEQPRPNSGAAPTSLSMRTDTTIDKSRQSGNVVTPAQSQLPRSTPEKVAPAPVGVIRGEVEQIHYGTSAITVAGRMIRLYGIGPFSFTDSSGLFAYWSTHNFPVSCVSQSRISYRCTYFDKKRGERDFSRVVVRFGAARAAPNAPKYLKQDERFARSNGMGEAD